MVYVLIVGSPTLMWPRRTTSTLVLLHAAPVLSLVVERVVALFIKMGEWGDYGKYMDNTQHSKPRMQKECSVA